jgi:hypothetical protein
MKRWVLAAGLLAAALASQALAADLDDGEPPPSWKGPSWKDGAYGYPPKSIAPPPGYYHDDEDDDDRPYSKYEDDNDRPDSKYEDDDDGPSKKYSSVPPHKGSCVRSEQVRDRLTSAGWRDFHAGKAVNPTTVTLRARRPSGRLFELRLDRCSGEILHAHALNGPPRPYYGFKGPDRPPSGGPYGYGPPGYMGPYAYGGPYGAGKQPPSWDWDGDDD